MEITKTKSGKLALKVVRNGKWELYSLRKIAVTGVIAMGITAAAATLVTREIKYNRAMENVQDLNTAAEEIEDMGVNAYIETKQGNYFIPDEIREYATVQEDLAKAKYNFDEDGVKKLQEKLEQKSIDINNIGIQMVKDKVEETFDNPDKDKIQIEVKATPDGPVPVAKQFNEYGNVDQIQQLDGEFVSALLQSGNQTDEVIQMMPEIIENGEGIKVK